MRVLRHAFRTLFKSPFVTTVAILSLGLGIGANAAIFSLFDQILLQPLPVSEPFRLVNLSAPGPKYGSTSCNQAGSCDVIFSHPMYRDLEKAPTALSGIAAHRLFSANVSYGGETLNGEAVMVSGSYFPVLGLQAEQGRLLAHGDDETIGANFVTVLSHSFWTTRLNADRSVVGKTITINGQPMTVVGIAPEGFHGTTLGPRPLAYVPLTMRAVMQPGFEGFDNRRNYWLYVFGRLAPDATIAQAETSLNAAYAPIINDVEAPLQQGMSDQVLTQFRAKRIAVEDGRKGQSSTHGEARIPLLLLFATAGIVLLIACANIANLLLARGAGRAMEMAVRLSLGASRRHVLTQLLTESVVLAMLGGLAGLLFARWTLAGMGAILPPEASQMLHYGLSPMMVLFCAALSVVTGLAFGLFPALHSTRSDLVKTIRANAGNLSATRGAARFRTTLVTVQIALSMMLLITAGLFLRSLTNISRVDLGMDLEQIVTFAVSPELNGYEPARAKQLFERLEEELAAQPGVTGVTAALVPVLSGSNWGTDVNVQGFQRGPDIDSNARFNEVGPAFFSTLGIEMVAGREFTAADNEGATGVAVVNEAFVKKFNLGNDAVGKLMGDGGDDDLSLQIVGVVKDAAYSEVKDEVPALFYRPWRQDERIGSMAFYVKTAGDPREIMRTIPPLVARLDRNLPVEELKTMPQQVRENVFLDRMIGTMASAFAGLATLLAAIGLYGVLAYTVARRTREIGVRMALGANSRNVLGMVLRQVGMMLLIGGALGIGAALFIGKAATSLLYGMSGRDPFVIVSAALLLSLLAFAAGYIPALKASRIDPLRALRVE